VELAIEMEKEMASKKEAIEEMDRKDKKNRLQFLPSEVMVEVREDVLNIF
jgi:hypothetical protein